MSDAGSSSSDALTSRALRVRRRDSVRRGVAAIDLLDLPPDVLVHILVLLPSLRDVCQVDCVCKLFYYGTPSFGRHSLVEAALRIRHRAHTGLSVPGSLVREPWWPWGSTKAKLVHDERCRRGAMLVPQVPDTVVNGDIDVRKRIVFFGGSRLVCLYFLYQIWLVTPSVTNFTVSSEGGASCPPPCPAAAQAERAARAVCVQRSCSR